MQVTRVEHDEQGNLLLVELSEGMMVWVFDVGPEGPVYQDEWMSHSGGDPPREAQRIADGVFRSNVERQRLRAERERAAANQYKLF